MSSHNGLLLVRQPECVLFGLTDAALRILAEAPLLLTHAERLASYLRSEAALSVLTLQSIRTSLNSRL